MLIAEKCIRIYILIPPSSYSWGWNISHQSLLSPSFEAGWVFNKSFHRILHPDYQTVAVSSPNYHILIKWGCVRKKMTMCPISHVQIHDVAHRSSSWDARCCDQSLLPVFNLVLCDQIITFWSGPVLFGIFFHWWWVWQWVALRRSNQSLLPPFYPRPDTLSARLPLAHRIQDKETIPQSFLSFILGIK